MERKSAVFPMFLAVFFFGFSSAKTISNGQIECFYTNLFGLSIEKCEKNSKNFGEISLSEMEANLYVKEIEETFIIAKINKNLNKKQLNLLEKAMEEFSEFENSFQNSPPNVKSCEYWKFLRHIRNDFAKNEIFEEKMDEKIGESQRKNINYVAIDCAKMEEKLENIGQNIYKKLPIKNHIEEFMEDKKVLHYKTIAFLMEEKDEIKNKKNWELSEYFGEKKLTNVFETEFAYKMRILRIENLKNNEKILTIKNKMEKLIGEHLLKEIEFKSPLIMSIDIIDDQKLAQNYVEILSLDEKLSENAEFGLAIRIFFGRIFEIFANILTVKKLNLKKMQKDNFLNTLKEFWEKKLMKILQTFSKSSAMEMYLFWHSLAQFYKKSKIQKKLFAKIGIFHLSAKNLSTMRDELLEQHTINLIRLNRSENAFSKFLKNSLIDEKATMNRLNQFYGDKNRNNVQLGLELFDKYADLRKMCRSELSIEQITKIGIRNYIRLLDFTSEELVWLRAEFLLNVLAYYKWLIFKGKSLPKGQLSDDLDSQLAMVENAMDAVPNLPNFGAIQSATIENIRLLDLTKNILFGQSNPLSISTFLASTHNEILKEMLQNREEFREKLKTIYIDRERLEKIIPKNFEIFKQLIDESVAKKPTKNLTDLGDFYAFNLTKTYGKLILNDYDNADDESKNELTISVLYFYHKNLREKLLSMLRLLKSKENAKFMRMAIELEVENVKLEKILSELGENGEKSVKMCYLASFTSWIIKNEAMANENEKWKKQLMSEMGENDAFLADSPPNSFQKWKKPNCDKNDEKTAKIVAKFLISPNFEQIHSSVLSFLFQEFPEFLQIVHKNAMNLPEIHQFANFDAQKEGISFYKKILKNENSSKAISHESVLSVKLLIQSIKNRQQILEDNAMENSQIMRDLAKAKAETFAIVRIIGHFKNGKNEIWRFVCPFIEYLKYLTARTFNWAAKWDEKHQCFGYDLAKIVKEQRKMLHNKHLELIETYLNEKESEEFLSIVIQQRGTVAKLRELLYTNGIIKLWENPKMQQKMLMDKKFFSNKNWLLDHYVGALTAPSEIAKQNEKISADFFVVMNSMEEKSENLSKTIQKLMHKLWLFVRISYENCNAKKENWNFMSIKIRNLIPKMEKILLNKNEKNKLKKILKKIKRIIEEEESGHQQKENAGKNKKIQKMHLKMLEKLLVKRQKEGELMRSFGKLVKTLNSDAEHRRNFLQFLDIDDLEKFFCSAGIVYNKSEIIQINENFNKNLKLKSETEEEEENSSMELEITTETTESTDDLMDASNEIFEENDAEKDSEEEEEEEMEQKSNDEIEKIAKKNRKKKKGHKNMKKIQNFMAKINKKELNFRSIYEAIIPLKAFCDDIFLYEKLKMTADKKSSIEKQIILLIGTIVNEIENRIKTERQMFRLNLPKYIYEKENAQKLAKLWAMIKEVSFTLSIENAENLHIFLNKLIGFLLDILSHLEGPNFLDEMSKSEHFEIEKVQLMQQIVVRKFAFSILKDEKYSAEWKELRNDQRGKKLIKVFGTKFDPIHFNQLKSDWTEMAEQIKIDTELYAKYLGIKNWQNANYIMPMFAKFSQQLTTEAYKRNESTETKKLENYLLNDLIKKSTIKNSEEIEKQIQNALIKLYSLVEQWSANRARLLISGSFLLGTNVFGSDIDLICVVPEKVLKKTDFFGTEQTFCEQNKCLTEMAEVSSFYCRICEDPKVTELVKITYGTVLVINFKFDGIAFDMPFVSIPYRKSLPLKINEENLSNFINKFSFSNIDHRKMLRAFSGHRSLLFINNLFGKTDNGNWDKILNRENLQSQKRKQPNKNGKNFRILLLTLKLWAKNNFIYSNKFGYLNGIILTIMSTKIVLLYPNSTMPFLLEKFFLFYAARPFNVPIQLKQSNYQAKSDLFFVRNPTEQQMPIFTPEFPAQNASKMVTHSTAKIIQRELLEALHKIKAMKRATFFDWSVLVANSIPFEEKYDTFVVINCLTQNRKDNATFCQFVDGRIRLQIVYSIDVNDGENSVVESRLFPGIYRENCELSAKFVKTNFRANSCKIWLLGIKLAENFANIDNLLDRFDQTIKKHYLKYNPIDAQNLKDIKKYFAILEQIDIDTELGKLKVELKSKLVKRSELVELVGHLDE